MAAYMALGEYYDAGLGAGSETTLDAGYTDYPTDVADSPGFTMEPEGAGGSGFDWSAIGAAALNVFTAAAPIIANATSPGAAHTPVGAQPAVTRVQPTTTVGGVSSKTLLILGGLGLAAVLLTRKS